MACSLESRFSVRATHLNIHHFDTVLHISPCLHMIPNTHSQLTSSNVVGPVTALNFITRAGLQRPTSIIIVLTFLRQSIAISRSNKKLPQVLIKVRPEAVLEITDSSVAHS